MRKILALIFTAVFFLGGCQEKEAINPQKLYMFYADGCSHCHEAFEYIDRRYPDLEMERINVGEGNGRELLFACARKFNIKNAVGTPLFCMGDHYIMGWSAKNINLFNIYVRPFLNKNEDK